MLHHIDAWQDSDYSSGSEHAMVLNMPGLHKALSKTFHYGYLIGFWIYLCFLNGRVTKNFCVNCILEIHGILMCPNQYHMPIPTSIYQEFHRVYWKGFLYNPGS